MFPCCSRFLARRYVIVFFHNLLLSLCICVPTVSIIPISLRNLHVLLSLLHWSCLSLCKSHPLHALDSTCHIIVFCIVLHIYHQLPFVRRYAQFTSLPIATFTFTREMLRISNFSSLSLSNRLTEANFVLYTLIESQTLWKRNAESMRSLQRL